MTRPPLGLAVPQLRAGHINGFAGITFEAVNIAPLPVPAAAPLILAGLGALGLRRARRG
ncbi:MAG: hypothetical protein AAFX52_10930 [Pseudomonadota bacterium]